MFVYLAANHFPWEKRFRPDLTPSWSGLGNAPVVDEYLRRQTMSADDYAAFVAGLKKKFPAQPFLIVRYGDHQPEFSSYILDPGLDEAATGKKFESYDPRYFATYYAIDTINFEPVKSPAVMETIDAPYLPLVIQEAAGIPLDPSFEEQKKHHAPLQGCVLCLQGRRRSPALQPAADRRRHRQEPLAAREANIPASNEPGTDRTAGPAPRGVRFYVGLAAVAALHLAALTMVLSWEYGPFAITLALLAWVFVNCLFLLVLPRPGVSAALALVFVVLLIALSRFKFDILQLSLTFLDFLMIDRDTFSFMLSVFPRLRTQLILAGLLAIPLLWVIWRIDPFRARRRLSLAVLAATTLLMSVMSVAAPEQPWEPFQGVNHISNLARSGVVAVSRLASTGWIEADPPPSGPLAPGSLRRRPAGAAARRDLRRHREAAAYHHAARRVRAST